MTRIALGFGEPGDNDWRKLAAAIERLKARDAELVKVVVLRYFGGFSVDDVSSTVGRSRRTVERQLSVAREWLRRDMGDDP